MNIIKDRNKLVEATSLALQNRLDEKFINNITNDPNPQILYHFTGNEKIRGIVMTNSLKGGGRLAISLTSNKNFDKLKTLDEFRYQIVFVLDAIKLSKDYDIERFIEPGFDEKEKEWIIRDNIINLDNYISWIGDNGIEEYALDYIKKYYPNIPVKKWN